MERYKYTTTDGMWTNCHDIEGDQLAKLKVKRPCGVCQSCIDCKKSGEITSKHEYGKMCKGSDNNHCSICSQIKQAVRMIRHVNGQCFKNCHYCNNKDYAWDRHVRTDGECPYTIRWLYQTMLRPWKLPRWKRR